MSKNMNKIGIIAEYNPFTNGHKYQLDYARSELNADCIIVAMSGSFCQRGEVCILDKYTRANCALTNGADIVLEIPVFFSTSSATDFAEGAVRLLAKTGITTLLFGVESGNEETFISVATELLRLENDNEFKARLVSSLKSGASYSASYYDAASQLLNIGKDFFLNSNNILGIEYTKSIIRNNYDIKIKCLKRIGNDYNDTSLNKEILSASAIRQLWSEINCTNANSSQNRDLCNDNCPVPNNTLSLISGASKVFANDISEMLHYALISNSDYEEFYDCTTNISNTIKNNLHSYTDFNSFTNTISSKGISVSRAKRILLHILLNIKSKEVQQQKFLGYITYIRILGFTKNGSLYLKDIKETSGLPVISSPSELKENDNSFNADIHSSDIYRILLTKKTGESLKSEFTRKNNLINL